MATSVAQGAASGKFRPGFHFWMVLLMTFFVFGGFGMTYLGPMARGTMPPTPPIVHLHGAVFFAWMLLLLAQTSLVSAGNVKLHRSMGTFGIALAGALVLLGYLITMISLIDTTWNADSYGLLYLSYVAPGSFAVIFALAIRAVRKPKVHRNLMLIATISILMPGINRLYMMSLDLGYVPFYATYLTMNAMLAVILYHERKATGTISGNSWIGAAIVVAPQLLFPLVVPSQAFHQFIDVMISWTYYR